RLMLPLDEQTREQVLAQLRIWRGVQPEAQPDSRGMTAAEVVELAASGRIEIGAHTVTHPLLTALPLISQQVEIQRSKAHLERLLARPIHGFSYPNGSVDRGTAVCTRLAGFAYACASHTDVARMGSDHFQLPRLWAADEPAASFAP